MKTDEEHRLKVEKGLEREAMMMGLRLRYIGVFAIFFCLSLFPLTVKLSFETGVLSLILAALSYMFVQYADGNDFFEKISSEKLPKTLVNDLHKRLKRGTD